jgi:dienelactone hydrolase
MKIVIESKRQRGIPALHMYRSPRRGRLPVVFLIHYHMGSKESLIDVAYRYAREGYYVIQYDSPHHGELEDIEYARLGEVEKDAMMPDIAAESAGFIDTIIRDNQGAHGADMERIALVGFSMGGLVIYQYLAHRLSGRIKAAVPCISTPVWEPEFREYAASVPGAENIFNEKWLKEVAEKQPSNFISDIADLPLLMVIGEDDTELSAEKMRSFYQKLLPHYRDKTRLRLVVQKGVGHSVTAESHQLIMDWIKKYL